jgi:glycosyltransferase involved in cell wall biosynthesis
MRILYFSRDYSPHDHRFLAALAETDHEVFYLRLEKSRRQTEVRPVPSKIRRVSWEGGQKVFHWRDLPRLTLGLRGVIKRVQPDLIHAGPIQDVGLLAALSGFRPLLIMSWGFDLMQDVDRNAWYRLATRNVLRRATVFTSDAEVTRQKAVVYGINPERTVVFPWGVDLERFSPRKGRKLRREPFSILCNRSWEPRYGVDVLARAFVQVAQRQPDVSLTLLSDGSQAELIHGILSSGGVIDQVHFGGQVSQVELPLYYHKADLFVSPSHIDGSSVSLMEALACGLPVVVSDIPANLEWVSDGINGWTFPDGDAQALADRILMVFAERRKLDKIERAARATAEACANWHKNFAKLLQAYEMAVQLARDERRLQ